MLHPTHRAPVRDFVGDIIAYENGDLSALQTLELFAHLIRTGQAWTLQGSYGRAANAFLEEGLLDGDGTITDLAIERLNDLDDSDDGDVSAITDDDERGDLIGENSDGSPRYEYDRIWY